MALENYFSFLKQKNSIVFFFGDLLQECRVPPPAAYHRNGENPSFLKKKFKQGLFYDHGGQLRS